MKRPFAFPVATLLLAAAVTMASAGPAQAGFLDALFGAPNPSPRYFEPEPDPLSVTVRKRANRKPAPPVERPPILQKSTLDPFKDPHWYLNDPTLRRGDIVVLKNRVLILRENGLSLRPGLFDDIRTTSKLSERERARIIAITEFPAGRIPKYTIVPDLVVPASTIGQLDRSRVQMILP